MGEFDGPSYIRRGRTPRGSGAVGSSSGEYSQPEYSRETRNIYIPGPMGLGWTFGEGVPAPGIGRLGEFYVDTSGGTWVFYGPKTEVGWGDGLAIGGTGGGATALDDLTDVNTAGVTNGDALVFDGSGWVPGAVSGGGGGSVNSVTASAPLASSGGVNPDISIDTSGFEVAGAAATAQSNAESYTDTVASTKADLVGGTVPSSQLPSYVDDVLEFANLAAFPGTGEAGKIYVAADTNLTYRWTGSAYGVLDPSLALGETPSSAACCAVLTGLPTSLVLSTEPRPTSDFVTL